MSLLQVYKTIQQFPAKHVICVLFFFLLLYL